MPSCPSCSNEVTADALFCSKCGKQLGAGQDTYKSEKPTRKRSKRWYLAPIFGGIVGGIIVYYAFRDENKKLAKNCLWIGIILEIVELVGSIGLGIISVLSHYNTMV